ncbi:MAG: hypothetical protein ACYC0B_08390 [Gemmatimonadaceae bacterium]
MRTLWNALSACGLVTVVACSHGTRPQAFTPAISPSGATITMRVRPDGAERRGELFASDSVGLIVMGDRLLRVRWDQLARVKVRGMGSYRFEAGSAVPRATRERLALVSRFPHGLSGDRLNTVLAALKQATLATLESGGIPAMPTESRRSSLDSLTDATALASTRYADRGLAIADGYRRIGTDFPGMGEHWLNTRTLLSERIDAAHPTMLVYARMLGVPTLVGVGFVLTTTGDSAPPLAPPGWPTAWHEHSGLLGDESAGVALVQAAADAARAPATRVWVLHVWNALENPAGRYVPDNWALPFARAGLVPPAGVEADAGRAFSLAVGGDAFLAAMLADAGFTQEPAARQAVDSLVAAALADAKQIVRRAELSGSREVSESDVAGLRATWRTLGQGLVAALGPEVARYMRPAGHH